MHLSYRRLYSELRVKCDYNTLGCSQIFHPKDLRAHLLVCEFTPAFCRSVVRLSFSFWFSFILFFFLSFLYFPRVVNILMLGSLGSIVPLTSVLTLPRWEGCPYNARAKRTEATQYLNQKMLVDHERSCENRLIVCDLPGCGEVMPFNKQAGHARACRNTLIDCTIKVPISSCAVC